MLSEAVDKGKVYADCCPIDGNLTLPGYQYREAIHNSLLDMLETLESDDLLETFFVVLSFSVWFNKSGFDFFRTFN